MDLFVKYPTPFEQEIQMPRTDKEGNPVKLPDNYATFEIFDRMILKLSGEDFKAGAICVEWPLQSDYDRPSTWMVITDIDENCVIEGKWCPVSVRGLNGDIMWYHPENLFVVSTAPYSLDWRVARYRSCTWE